MSSATAELWTGADTAAVQELSNRSAATPDDRRQTVKRVLDATITLTGMLIALPLMGLIALGIRLSDGGPVLFCQTRVGHNGRLFTIYKFRTMVVDAEAKLAALSAQNESAQHLFKMKHDPRITPLGRILRRLSLDELPQLFNVLNGDMSLVGPRPHLPAEVAAMSPEAQRRAAARPGITGLWQISGRSDLDEATSVSLDLRYVDTWSLKLDLVILVGTVAAVVTARGAH
jgi:lipopolysaccharide/colanic/teichoic acid biosynthesis glycosyltransferase